MSEKSNKNTKNIYDDDNIPEVDLPRDELKDSSSKYDVEPLPESSRPRKDGPGWD